MSAGVEIITEPYEGYLEAWRVWLVDVLDDKIVGLHSVSHPDKWHPYKTMRAHCHVPAHWNNWEGCPCMETPFKRCLCGIYAWQDEADCFRYIEKDFQPQYHWTQHYAVVGRVALWGDILVCEYGYRAAKAYPLSFDYLIKPKFANRGTTEYMNALCYLRDEYEAIKDREDAILSTLEEMYGLN